ncbi:hypothetical protein [Flavobacterium soli]|uniref:hypothetical protein n=1 Tax=Flavobacterium soli TaxID=344881 RepID=UPI0003FAD25D|nr:hypothetical protein [Flavobacterium soli]
MEFIHFVETQEVTNILNNGIKATDNYRGLGILIYPYLKIPFRAPTVDYLSEEIEVNKKSIEECWAIIASAKLRQEKKKITALIFQCELKNWPIEVFIDIDSEIATDFAKAFELIEDDLVSYYNSKNLSEVLKSIEFSNFVLESRFKVYSELGLKLLIDSFTSVNGGIWKAHSFDCMTLNCIDPKSIIKIIDL